jgi:hypothetical protein
MTIFLGVSQTLLPVGFVFSFRFFINFLLNGQHRTTKTCSIVNEYSERITDIVKSESKRRRIAPSVAE